MWALLLQGVLVVQMHRASTMDYKGNTYSVQELSQEFPPPGAGGAVRYPWAEEGHNAAYAFPGAGSYPDGYSTFPENDYPGHFPRFYTRPPADDGRAYEEAIPSIHDYRPSFAGRDYNEYPHILPPGGKSIEQLQQEADLRIKKIYFDSRENQRVVSEKIKKLTDTYGYGTIGYPGYRNSIRYEPIDLGTHKAVDLGSTLDGPNGNLRLPVQTVTVTKTLGVRVPQPYPVKQEVPVPAPFPVPVSEPHFDGHDGRGGHAEEARKYFGKEFARGDGLGSFRYGTKRAAALAIGEVAVSTRPFRF